MGLRKDLLHAWWLPGGLAILALGMQAGGSGVRSVTAWDRAAIGGGETWRLVTGHVVHLSWSHLLVNLAGLALVWLLVGRHHSARGWVLVAGTSLLAIDLGLWWLNPELDWYVGLSGLLHGLLAGGLLMGLLKRDRESAVLVAFVLAKLAWEQLAGPLPGSEATAGGAVIVDAHLYGAAGGLLGALLLRIRVRAARPI